MTTRSAIHTLLLWLRRAGLISPEHSRAITRQDGDSSYTYQFEDATALIRHLVQTAAVPERGLAQMLGQEAGYAYVDLEQESITPAAIACVPFAYVQRYQCLPLSIVAGKLRIALGHPFGLEFVDELSYLIEQPIVVCIAELSLLEHAIQQHYPQRLENLEERQLLPEAPLTPAGFVPATNDSLEQYLQDLLADARDCQASDIHIETSAQAVRVRYRVDGSLQVVNSFEKCTGASLMTKIKLLAHLDIAEKRRPQEGKFQYLLGNERLNIRAAILPTTHGEQVTLRLLGCQQQTLTLDQLGLSVASEAVLRQLMTVGQGVLLLSGPTGSGKTTTLASLIGVVGSDVRKIVTIEDPIEYQIPGAVQVQVNPNTELTFSSALRSMLRHAPDVIVVGEIRDTETAVTALQAGLTGHQVLSTVHANSALSSIARLRDLQVPSYLIASAVQALVAQRLVRKICRHCRRLVTISQEYQTWANAVGLDLPKSQGYESAGCGLCGSRGYDGRLGVFEYCLFDDELSLRVAQACSTERMSPLLQQQGFISLAQDALAKAMQGLISLTELRGFCSALNSVTPTF